MYALRENRRVFRLEHASNQVSALAGLPVVRRMRAVFGVRAAAARACMSES